MASNTIDKKLEVFAFTAHIGPKAVSNYEDLFDYLISLTAKNRVYKVNDKVISIPVIEKNGKRVKIIAYEGEQGVNPLMYDHENMKERVEKLKKNETLATKTRVIIDLAEKRAVAEYNHKGAKAGDIGEVLTHLTAAKYAPHQPLIQFTHVAGDGFIEAIEKLSRVRVASVKFARPNPGWSDAHDKLVDVAEESGAHFVNVEFTASRGDNLNVKTGIIGFLKKTINQGLSIFSKVEVKGHEAGIKKEKSIKLENFVESRTATVNRDANGHPEEAQILSQSARYLDEMIRKERLKKDDQGD